MAPFFGYHIPNFSFPDSAPGEIFPRLVELARAAEAADFDLITVMDHFYQIGVVGPETEPMLEAYTTLGALATQTSRVQLGTLVTGVTYRNPALLAKTITTLDNISGGRAILGIGAAWNEDEHRGYGFSFPPIGERMDRLDEALRIATLMFKESRPSFSGTHYRIDRALNVPRPVRPGGPPILIGGGGEKRTLRLVARYADISHWFGSLEEMKRKLEVLERHCEAEGRDSSTILKTVGSPVILVEDEREAESVRSRLAAEGRAAALTPARPQEAAERLSGYIQAGFGGFTFGNPTLPDPRTIALAGELKQLLS
ncbi:MAG TPA: TIGR03560 family F420-dependent LLM class oxidoreductase [Candidatus Nitrosotalea sp.]|nr:TIGR03560 family F420-dependent LLM class oxidoreductase [Candidatus Nitrosotalea sp.]